MLSHVDEIPGVPGNKVMYTVSTHIQAKFASMRTHTHIHTNKKYVFNPVSKNQKKKKKSMSLIPALKKQKQNLLIQGQPSL